MFGYICNSLYILLFLTAYSTGDEELGPDISVEGETSGGNGVGICGIDNSELSSLTNAFTIGDKMYIGTDDTYYPIDINDMSPKEKVSSKEIFQGLELNVVKAVIHFQGPFKCQPEGQEVCIANANADHLVIAFDSIAKRYQSFRYSESGLKNVADASQMPWRLQPTGTYQDFYATLGPAYKNMSEPFIGAMFSKDTISLYLLFPSSTTYHLTFVAMGGDASFNSSEPGLKIVKINTPINMMAPSKKDNLAIIKHSTGPKVASMQIMGEMATIGEEQPIRDYFHCNKDNTSETKAPDQSSESTGSDSESGDLSPTPDDSGMSSDRIPGVPARTTQKTRSTSRRPDVITTPKPAEKSNWTMYIIIVIVLIVIIIALLIAYCVMSSQSNEEEPRPQVSAPGQVPEAPEGQAPPPPPPTGGQASPAEGGAALQEPKPGEPVVSSEIDPDTIRSVRSSEV